MVSNSPSKISVLCQVIMTWSRRRLDDKLGSIYKVVRLAKIYQRYWWWEYRFSMNRANSSYNYGFHDVRLSKEKRVETKVKVWSFVLKLLLAWGKNAKRHFHKTAAKSRYAVKILEKPFFISSATTIKVTILTKLGDFCKFNFLIILLRL